MDIKSFNPVNPLIFFSKCIRITMNNKKKIKIEFLINPNSGKRSVRIIDDTTRSTDRIYMYSVLEKTFQSYLNLGTFPSFLNTIE